MKAPIVATQNDLPEGVRCKAIALLNEHLADAIDVRLQAKQAHWNVKGPNFIALHELFDEVEEEIADLVDEIAERAMQLGGVAKGTVQVVAKESRLSAYPLEILAGGEHVQALSRNLATFGKSVRGAIDATVEFNDADTADLFTQVSRGIDKLLWKVEAHGQAVA